MTAPSRTGPNASCRSRLRSAWCRAGQVSGPQTRLVIVFAAGPGGGNPAPIIAGRRQTMTDAEMRAVAAAYGHESAFVLPPPPVDAISAFASSCPTMKWKCAAMPRSARSGCLHRLGRLPRDHVNIATLSGVVEARIETGQPLRSASPRASVDPCRAGICVADILSVLGIGKDALAATAGGQCGHQPGEDIDAAEKRRNPGRPRAGFRAHRSALRKDGFDGALSVRDLRPEGPNTVEARQFPKSSGYPEDAATGIAAAALAFGLLEAGRIGAEGRPSGAARPGDGAAVRTSRCALRRDMAGAICRLLAGRYCAA